MLHASAGIQTDIISLKMFHNTQWKLGIWNKDDSTKFYISEIKMSEEGSCDDGAEGLLPESDVLNLMRRMQDMNLPVSPEEIQVRRKWNVTLVFWSKVTIVRF